MGRLIQRFTYLLSRVMEVIAGIALIFMMTLTTCDVILRAFSRPIIGTYEMVALAGGVVIGFSLPITSWLRGQIFVDFFYQTFPKFWQNVLNVITRLMALTLFLFVGWNLMILASDMVRSGRGLPHPAAPLLPDSLRDWVCMLRAVPRSHKRPVQNCGRSI